MIVKCEQCHTRFKIPDEKVTDKGVKVRCTKCSHTFRVTRDMAQPATVTAPAAAFPAGDPFAKFGAPQAPPAAARPLPQAAQPFDFGSLSPPSAAPSVPVVPASNPPANATSPFDFAAVARPAAEAPAAFDFSNFAAAATQPVAPTAPPRPPPPPPPAISLPAFDFSQAALPAPSSGSAFDPGGSADGFFAGAHDEAPAAMPIDEKAARAMFDMPPPAASLLDLPPPEVEVPPPISASSRNIEHVALGRTSSNPPSTAFVARPSPDAPPRRSGIVGIIVNVVIAAMLVVGLVFVGSASLNEGRFTTEALSLEGLRNTFAPSVDFVADDVSNGLYETRAGRSVFFVRGEVMNRSEATVKVVVKAEIVETGKVVRFAESWAGEPATPEELFNLDSAEALEALNRKVEKRSVVVPPGHAAAFVVPFTEYPPDLKGFRVRVSARAVAVNPSAATP